MTQDIKRNMAFQIGEKLTNEPDPRDKDMWLVWRVRKGDVTLLGAYEAWNKRIAEWNAEWQKELGGHIE